MLIRELYYTAHLCTMMSVVPDANAVKATCDGVIGGQMSCSLVRTCVRARKVMGMLQCVQR